MGNLNDFIHAEKLLPPKALSIQNIDLNNDMIPEYVVAEQDCVQSRRICKHYILAAQGASFVVIGTFDALKILPAPQYTNGVRNILVYNNVKNEFKYDVVTWNSRASSYTPYEQAVQR